MNGSYHKGQLLLERRLTKQDRNGISELCSLTTGRNVRFYPEESGHEYTVSVTLSEPSLIEIHRMRNLPEQLFKYFLEKACPRLTYEYSVTLNMVSVRVDHVNTLPYGREIVVNVFFEGFLPGISYEIEKL